MGKGEHQNWFDHQLVQLGHLVSGTQNVPRHLGVRVNLDTICTSNHFRVY
jgi:hypothetical protein